MGNKPDDRSVLLISRAHLGDYWQRLDAIAVQVNDNQRRLFFNVLSFFSNVFIGFYEFNLHVELARDFLDLGHKEEVVNESKDPRWRILPLHERFHIRDSLRAVV